MEIKKFNNKMEQDKKLQDMELFAWKRYNEKVNKAVMLDANNEYQI